MRAGHARERGEREQPRQAQDDPRADHPEHRGEHGRGREHAVMAGRREEDDQRPATDRPGSEPADAQLTTRTEDQQREPERAARAGDLCDDVVHATTTTHLAAWPAANT